MLMFIGVEKGADENKTFQYYVGYLKDHHFAPPESDSWIDHIRQKGNEMNHEIVFATKSDAERLITFTWSLLYCIYEMPNAMNPN